MTVSGKYIVAFMSVLFLFAACGKKEKELTPEQVRAKADSIVLSKMKKLKQQAKEDLDRRLPIEIKPKVDSILKINGGKQTVPVFPEDNIGAEEDTGTPVADSAKNK